MVRTEAVQPGQPPQPESQSQSGSGRGWGGGKKPDGRQSAASAAEGGTRPRQPLAVAALVAAAVVGVQALLVPLFAAPAANIEPRDLPVVVAGPAPAVTAFVTRLEGAQPGAFDVSTVADAATADQALRDREAYAAFLLSPAGVTLHTASAASPTVAAMLTQAAGQLAEGKPVPVVDVVPVDPDDPRGGGFGAGFLPLAMTSLMVGVLLSLLVRDKWARLAGLATFAVLAGLVGAAVLRGWLGVLPGTYLVDAAAAGLFALAAAGTVLGLAAALGRPGIALGALLVFLVSNPLSAVTAAPELLPQPWGEVGQWLPVGAGGTLLRSVAYFDGAGGGPALFTLVGYALIGVLLLLAGRARTAVGS